MQAEAVPAYLRHEWVDNLRGQRFRELQEEEDGELEPRQRRALYFLRIRSWCDFLSGICSESEQFYIISRKDGPTIFDAYIYMKRPGFL